MANFRFIGLFAVLLFSGYSYGQSFKATDTLTSIFDSAGCGLNYVQASRVLGQKMVFNGLPYTGVAQPSTFSISGIPSGATIERAYIWWDLTGSDTVGSVIIENPSSNIDTIAGTLLGSGGITECWGIGAAAFRAEVTSSVTGNGDYIISGLPVDSIASDSTVDVNGATLFIIYSEFEASYIGAIAINDGFFKVKFGTNTQTISDLTILDTSDFATAFMLVSDLQGESGNGLKFNNGPYVSITEEFWDFEEKSTLVSPSLMSSTYGVQVPNDCANFIMIGLYYQINITKATPSITQNVDTLTSSVGTTYQWFHEGDSISGAEGQNYITTQNGNYTVSVSYGDGCAFSSTSFFVSCIESFVPTVLTDSGSYMWTTDSFGFTYQWFSDTVAIFAATNSGYYSSDTGNFFLQLTDTLGCISLSDTIHIDSVSLNPGIEKFLMSESFSIYPNPSNGIFRVTARNIIEGNLLVEVNNITGALVRSREWNSGHGSLVLDLTFSKQGVYFVKISSELGVVVKKVVRL